MKRPCINLSLIFIIIFFISLNTIDTSASGGIIRRTPTYRHDSGWKAGEGKKDDLYKGPPAYKKGEIPDNSKTLTNGCFVTFIGIPVALLILYLIFSYLKNTGTHTSDTTYYYDEDGKIDRMSEE
ncbi:MAG: hypothetical protein ABRQ39_07665 [Candidatus Eremiobacterota bacterium]